jgi:hypothetical protein
LAHADSYIHPITLLAANVVNWVDDESTLTYHQRDRMGNKGGARMQNTRRYVLIGSPARKEGDGIKRIQKIKSIPPAPSSL